MNLPTAVRGPSILFGPASCFGTPPRSSRPARIVSILLVLTALIGLLAAAGASPAYAEQSRISFKWAFIHRSPDGQPEIIDFGGRPGPRVTAGDELQIYLEALGEVYLYIYLYDTTRTLYPIFPEEAGYDAGPLPTGSEHRIPGPNSWFTWDEARGRERFTILASTTRLVELERITERFNSSGGDRELGAELYNHIERLRKENSDWPRVTEKPVAIAGTVRTRGPGGAADVGLPGDATLVEAEGFYGKTLRLRHE